MNRSLRQSVIAVAVGALAATAVGLGIHSAGIAPAAAPAPSGEGAPGALGKHLEDLKRASPGGAEVLEGPGSAAEAAFQERAYPASTISVGKMEAAKKSFQKAFNKSRQLSRTNARSGRVSAGLAPGATWKNVGPSRALYPFTERRNNTNYVPNEYVAGGRTTDLAVAKTCVATNCKMYITPAGGGVWSTDDAMAKPPVWTYRGGPLGINAAGTVTIDPRDASGNTIWVGTGEANVCGSGCVAGVGIYKSTDGGATFTGPLGQAELGGKGIGEIVVDPRPGSQTVYAATTSALRGMSSVCCSGVTRPVPGAAQWGLYKSTNGGGTWTMIHNGTANEADCTGTIAQYRNLQACSPRGVRHFELDPSNPDTMYAGSYARGIWRSTNSGADWTQIKPSLNAAVIPTRPAFDVVKLPDGKTRMYVHEGNIGTPYSRLFRSDDVTAASPVFTDLTSANPADPGYATYNQCGGQCWYDLFVTAPDANPDMVYTGGSYAYGETGRISNGRAVVLSTDAGVSGTDMTMDDTSPRHPNGLHPDQHALVVHPDDPNLFFEANDGGLMRSTGKFASSSDVCGPRGLTGAALARCQQLLSKVPDRLIGMNDGLNTLQFGSLSVSPANSQLLQGGTQDNGTWQNDGQGGTVTWENTMIGDGGASGFDSTIQGFRMHNFFDATPEVQFSGGDVDDWIWTADPIFGQARTQFYAPVITDPVVSKTMFAGTGRTVYRTQTAGIGDRSLAEAQRICNTWDGTFEAQCGDWEEAGPRPLTGRSFGGDRIGGAVAAIERATSDTKTAWAATTTGRLFVTPDVDTRNPDAISWYRVDDDSAIAPNRFVSSIDIDARNPNVAYVSYSGYSASTPGAPGHVFKVTWNGKEGFQRAVWTDLSANLTDMPVTDLVLDDTSGDLYASTDFGVLRRAAGSSVWTAAATGMPFVEVAGLTISPDGKYLYAASHGLSAWQLTL